MTKKTELEALTIPGERPVALELVKPKLRPIDWAGAVDITTLTLPHMMAMTGGHGLVVGGEFKGGGHFSGVIRKMTIMPNGVIRVIVELGAQYQTRTGSFGAFAFFGNGMYAEIDDSNIEPISEENTGPWQKPIGSY